MKKKLSIYFIICAAIIFSQDSTKQISINLPSGIDIDLKGKVEFEFVDVEGIGGAINSTEFLQKIQTRSPYVRIDKAVLNFKILYSENISFRFGLRFDDNNAYVDKSYLLFQNPGSKLEIGSNRPAIALNREVEGYPLIGTAFWKGRQYHIDYEKQLTIMDMKLGGSVALKRPLAFDAPAEDDSYPMLVYGNMPTITRKWDGVTTEFGLRSEINFGILRILGWGYFGELYDDSDWRLLYEQFTYYRYAQGQVLPKDANRDHYWAGIRSELYLFGFFTRGEYIISKDGFLDRNGFYIETRKSFNPPYYNPLLILARFGSLNIEPGGTWEAQLDDPHTWDRTLITLAAVYNLTDYAKIKLEYYITGEETGDTDEKAKSYNYGQGREYQPDMVDNQLLVQFELNF